MDSQTIFAKIRLTEIFILDGFDVRVLTETYTTPDELASKIHDVEALVLIRERTKINSDDGVLSWLRGFIFGRMSRALYIEKNMMIW
jgi:hypothetical protein